MSSIRDAERERIYDEYADRVGESVTGTVQQSDSRYTLIKLREGVEALLPPQEQPHNERYDHNQRLKAYIVEVRKTSNEPSIVVSRTHPGLIRRLFELEVPEIYDGIVEIKSVAREPGARSKVAVSSREPGLDPVGACVGPKGSRVRMIVSELRGERIDVVPWSEDPANYVANALSPAKVDRVVINEDSHTATVIVPDDQLSLAIGKEGQNARLAAKLTGWRIDIKSSSMAGETGRGGQLGGDDSAAEEFDGRCIGVTSSGIRCRNQARPGSYYCGVHDTGSEEEAVKA
jgi:N utilization substance protein A